MSATVILSPAAAVNAICHEEQLRIWAHDNIIDALALGDFLNEDMDYDDKITLERVIMREIKSILTMAFDHPNARTISLRDNQQERESDAT